MRHFLLDPHQKIGWDIDGTVVNGPHSEFFRAYIIKNPQKEHHFITFRDWAWAQDVYDELGDFGVPRDRIAGVHDCPQDLYMAWTLRQLYGEDHDQCQQFVRWKGMTAKKLGCSVLVDDMADLVTPGCDLHGVVFVSALDARFL